MINIMLFVPQLLVQYRFRGTVPAMLLAVAYGCIVPVVTAKCFGRFPGMGLPEIAQRFLPRWAVNVMLAYGFAIWGAAGIIVVYIYAELMRMFFYPDMNPYANLALMVGASAWAATRSTRTVQFVQEIVMLLSVPLIFLILLKAIFNQNLNWDAIRVAAGYVNTPPSFVAFCAATILYTGFLSLAVFNRSLTSAKIRFLWIIPLFGTFFLLVSFFVPIGFHGTMAVEHYAFLWSMTADSMEMDYGFINRVLYGFLLLYTGLSLLFAMNTWHSSIEFVKAMRRDYKPAIELERIPPVHWIVVLALGAATFIYAQFVNDEWNKIISTGWLILRLLTEVFVLLLMLWFVRQQGSHDAAAAVPALKGRPT